MLTFEEAVVKLTNSERSELRDHYFGDKEVYFSKDGEDIAEGYVGRDVVTISFTCSSTFEGEEARRLLKMGSLVNVERNDSSCDSL